MENNLLPAVVELPVPPVLNPVFYGNYWEYPNNSCTFYAADCSECLGGGHDAHDNICFVCNGSGVMPAPGCPPVVSYAILKSNQYDEDNPATW